MSLASEWPEPSGGLVPAGLVLSGDDDADPVGAVDPELAAWAAEAFAADSAEPPVADPWIVVDDWPERVESEADPLLILAAIEAAADLDADQTAREVADLDDDALLAAAAVNQKAINTSQAHQLALAAHWADLHNADAMRPPTQPSAASRYREGLVARGGDGAPGFAEFAPAALAAVLHMSAAAASSLMVDALDVRHRLPRLWARVQAGRVKAYLARRAAVATRHLSLEAAARVDARLAGVADTITTGRFTTTLTAAVAAADPTRAAAEAAEAGRGRGVWIDPEIDHGLSTLFARANAADLAAFNRALDLISRALKALGDTDDPDVRRATAIGILACPQAALDLVNQAEAARKTASAAAAARRAGTPDPDLEQRADTLRRFHFAPAVLYMHLSDQTLADPDTGLVRVEDVGPVLARQVKDWLAHTDVTVKPVIDLPNLPGIDGYETPGWLSEAVHLRTPTDCWPYSGNQSRRTDIDHTTPYRHPDHDTGSDGAGSDGGGSGGGSPPDGNQPPGQTRLDNLGPLTRANHRRKTFSDWKVTQPRSGTFVWRDPTGRHYLVDGNGTTPLGKLWSG